MKKLSILILTFVLVMTLAGCGMGKDYDIKIVIPAGSQAEFAFSEEEISPKGSRIVISAGDGLGDTEVLLKPVQVKEKTAYEPAYLTPGMPVTMAAEKGAWFQIGVAMQNPTDEDIIVYVHVENVEVRIE